MARTGVLWDGLGMENYQHVVDTMKVGQAVQFDPAGFKAAFPPLGIDGYGGYTLQQAIDRFLSRQVGSAYGGVRVKVLPDTGRVLVTKHEPDASADHCSFVYHVDPDRQWMFDRTYDGWERRPDSLPASQ